MKIFLVEDEVFALRTLSRKILDLQKDYEIVGTAKDGTEALPKIIETKPAVVITDIRMRDMDGLTLIQKMREENVTALPVIISGYQEFEYAKQAMRLGVEDYLLKPVELAELDECLENCRKKLEEQYVHKNIYSFLIGDEKFSLESITSNDQFILVYMIFCAPLNNSENLLHPVTGHISGTKMYDFLSAKMPGYSVFCFDGIFSNEKIILLNSAERSREEGSALLEHLVPELAGKIGFPVTAFYLFSGADALTYNIQAARRGCVRNAVLGESGCYHTLPPAPASENLTEFIELLTLLIRQNDQELLHSNMMRLCGEWKKKRRTVVACQADLIYILKALNQNFPKKDRQLDPVFYVENIYCFFSGFGELAVNFSQLLTGLFSPEKSSEEHSLSGAQLVQKIEQYFRDNLSRTITLQLLADEMNVSKVYLCRIFKKYKNITPIDYFNRLKIERACELLTQFPSLPLQKISDTLGFNDVYYFSKVFKKIAGMSPSGYRKPKNGQEHEA